MASRFCFLFLFFFFLFFSFGTWSLYCSPLLGTLWFSRDEMMNEGGKARKERKKFGLALE